MNIYLAMFKGLAIGLTVTGALRFGEGNLQRVVIRRVNQALFNRNSYRIVILHSRFLYPYPAWFIKLFTSDAQILAMGLPLFAPGCDWLSFSCSQRFCDRCFSIAE